MGDGNEEVTSPKFTQQHPHLPSRVGAWALMRDPVELLGRRLKEHWDVETGQARRGEGEEHCVCRCVSGFCLPYWNGFWMVKHPGRAVTVTVWRMFVKLSSLKCGLFCLTASSLMLPLNIQ